MFSDANANSTYLNALRDKVSVELTPDLGLTVSEMEVELAGGRILRARHDSGIPMNDRTTQGTRVADKFHALVALILGKDRSGRIAATVGRLETLPHLGSLMRLCV